MTTEIRPRSVVLRASAVSAATAAVLVPFAGLVDDGPAAAGAAVGGVVAVGIFAFGALAVDAVARLMPTASLIFAMLTYTLQVVVLALVFVGLNRSGLLDTDLDRRWLGAAIVLGALVWTATQLRLATTARIPAFEPSSGTPARVAVPAPGTTTFRDRPEGGAR